MSNELLEKLGQQRTDDVKRIVDKADFSKCPAGFHMKEVYGFMIDTLSYLVQAQIKVTKDDDNGELKLLGGKLLSMKGIKITGRDVVLLCVISGLVLVWVDKIAGYLFK